MPAVYVAPLALLFSGALVEATDAFARDPRVGAPPRLAARVRPGLRTCARPYVVAARQPRRGRGRRRQRRRAPELHGPPGGASCWSRSGSPRTTSRRRALWHDLGLDDGAAAGGRARQSRARAKAATGDAEAALADLLACGELRARVGHPHARALHVALRRRAAARRQRRARARLREDVERARASATRVRSASRCARRAAGRSPSRCCAIRRRGSSSRLALLEHGAALRRAGQRVAAREPLREAVELAARAGRPPSPPGRTTSSSPPAPARGATRSRAAPT